MNVHFISAMFFNVIREIPRLPARARALWSGEFRDARLILEQDGTLRYFAVSAALQQGVVRGALVFAGVTASALVTLGATTIALHWQRTQLERTQLEVRQALAGIDGTLDYHGTEAASADHSLTALAQQVTARDRELRQLVTSVTSGLNNSNAQIRSRLSHSGLDEDAINMIQRASPAGGVSVSVADRALRDPLLSVGFSSASATNLMLRTVLNALPTGLPGYALEATSGFGVRIHPVTGDLRMHKGVDFISLADDTVRTVKPGRVVMAGAYPEYGNVVVIEHDRGVQTLYGHLRRIDVRVGETVTRDQPIGLIGATGLTTGKHLHYEVSIGGVAFDPLELLQVVRDVQ